MKNDEKFTNMGTPEAPLINQCFSFHAKLSGKTTYLLDFINKRDSIEINSKSLEEPNPPIYKGILTKDNFLKFHKFFRQFDNIDEIFDFLKNIGLEKITTIFYETNTIKIKIEIPSLLKNKGPNTIILMLVSENTSPNDLLNTLIEKVKEIDELKKRVDFLYKYFDIKEYDVDLLNTFNDSSMKIFKAINSKIFKSHNEISFINQGIIKALNKSISKMELIYRASRDGDNSKCFHNMCDGKNNTLTIIKTSVGKRFGGFTQAEWSSEEGYINDEKTFLFSFDDKEFYFIKKEQTEYAIFCNRNYGPSFGKGPDLYISSNCRNNSSFTKQESFDYKGKTDALVGKQKFSAIDYEIYQLVFN